MARGILRGKTRTYVLTHTWPKILYLSNARNRPGSEKPHPPRRSLRRGRRPSSPFPRRGQGRGIISRPDTTRTGDLQTTTARPIDNNTPHPAQTYPQLNEGSDPHQRRGPSHSPTHTTRTDPGPTAARVGRTPSASNPPPRQIRRGTQPPNPRARGGQPGTLAPGGPSPCPVPLTAEERAVAQPQLRPACQFSESKSRVGKKGRSRCQNSSLRLRLTSSSSLRLTVTLTMSTGYHLAIHRPAGPQRGGPVAPARPGMVLQVTRQLPVTVTESEALAHVQCFLITLFNALTIS